ncbi:MAG: M81 family metallopeptidase, partial [Bryobacteraceae bacterium]
LRIVIFSALSVMAMAQTRPRIAVGSIMHESNSFNAAKTGLADFVRRPVAPVAEALRQWEKNKDEVSGYVEGAERYGLDLIPTLLATATPKGPVTDEALDALTAGLIAGIRAAGKIDGLLLALHGAMVTESHPHGDAEVVRRIRAATGPSLPIVVTHDFHANVSPEIVELSTALITYKEVPHLDQRERGVQAARIMAGIASGKLKPVQAIAKPPMIYNIVYHNTSRKPLAPIVEESRRLEKDPRFLAVSVPGGYQYADVPAVGPSAIVVTNNDRGLAEREAKRLSDMLWETRTQMKFSLPDPAAAVKRARASAKTPVVLVEMGDNIGGGSAGDATFLLSELVKQKAEGWFVALADGEAAKIAAKAGIGGRFDQAVGGRQDKLHGDPVRIRGTVRTLTDGRFVEPEVRHGGQRYYDQGLTAVIEVEGSTPDNLSLVMLTSKRMVPFSIHQLVSAGVYPQRQKILVVKAAVAFRAAYEPVAGEIIEVDTGGTTAVNPARFTYRRARRPLFGLE